ncbi:hypothetical protein Btru_057920 [Bulinus truncatus]|nr:hypothetical protein Btru_057920 [Bulinus truncatus]
MRKPQPARVHSSVTWFASPAVNYGASMSVLCTISSQLIESHYCHVIGFSGGGRYLINCQLIKNPFCHVVCTISRQLIKHQFCHVVCTVSRQLIKYQFVMWWHHQPSTDHISSVTWSAPQPSTHQVSVLSRGLYRHVNSSSISSVTYVHRFAVNSSRISSVTWSAPPAVNSSSISSVTWSAPPAVNSSSISSVTWVHHQPSTHKQRLCVWIWTSPTCHLPDSPVASSFSASFDSGVTGRLTGLSLRQVFIRRAACRQLVSQQVEPGSASVVGRQLPHAPAVQTISSNSDVHGLTDS